MAAGTTILEWNDNLEILPSVLTPPPGSPALTVAYEYSISGFRPCDAGTRAEEGWQRVMASGPDRRYLFHLPDGEMQVRVRSVYSELETVASEPSNPQTCVAKPVRLFGGVCGAVGLD